MPLGTPEDNEAARAAEIADVELEHGPHRKHDFHEFLDGIASQAARLSEIRDANPGLSEQMSRVESNVMARQQRREKVGAVAGRCGFAVMRWIFWGVGYDLKNDRWCNQQTLVDEAGTSDEQA